VIMTGGIDLSVGSMLFLAAAIESSRAFVSAPAGVVFAAIAVTGLLMGLVNGVAIALTRVPALIVTLASMQVFRGAGGQSPVSRTSISPRICEASAPAASSAFPLRSCSPP